MTHQQYLQSRYELVNKINRAKREGNHRQYLEMQLMIQEINDFYFFYNQSI